MSAPTAAADTVLAGRYRLLRVRSLDAETGAGDLWRAHDETLARAVAVRVLPSDDDRAPAMLAAAGRAGQLADTRLARVLDAAEDGGYAFVVGEWVEGESLGSTLRSYGPLEPTRATSIVLETGRVIAAAHTRGLAHLRLHPENVLLGRTGSVTVTDLEVAAALAGIDAASIGDLRAVDASALGALLYAALTARWPGTPGHPDLALHPAEGTHGLPPAPRTDGHVASPRQVRAGIPREIDAVVDRALSPEPRRGLEPLRTPSAVVAALTALPQARAHDVGDDDDFPSAPGRARRILRVVIPLALVIAIGVTAWLAGLAIGRVPGPGRGYSAAKGPAGNGNAAVIAIPANGVTDFDPEGDGEENRDQVPLSHDGDPSTPWQTTTYKNRPDFGGLKSGVGLLVDLGRVRIVSSVTVLLTTPGANLELRAADQPATTISGYRVVATADDAGHAGGTQRGSATLKPATPVRARYWVIWFTRLPKVGGEYVDGIAEMTFRG